ncbi:hypothetical protein FJTKL_01437 [Diaporthe vaccinii]|uniref:Uncharacterized protein n=1 Tax=Diaporthe vaccinii TaxID=105482 RepID=A0ABR4E0V1_9PEZI
MTAPDVQIQGFPQAALTPGTNNRADRALGSALDVRVLHDLALVVADLGLGDGALGVVALALGGGVVGRQDGGGGPDDGADLVVELLCLRLLDGGLERRALLGVGGGRRGGVGGEGHGGVLGQVVVVVRLGADDGAGLAWHVEVDVWVRGGQDRVGCSDDGADLRHGGCCVCLCSRDGGVDEYWFWVDDGVVGVDGRKERKERGRDGRRLLVEG